MTISASQWVQGSLPDQIGLAIGQRERAGSTLNNAALAEQCHPQLYAYRCGEPYDESSGLELLRRATVEGDPEAWAWVQRCFSDTVLAWLRCYPSHAAACRLESEATYVALAFERFWLATTLSQQVAFRTLAAALRYLRASLHSAILDTLRAYSRPKEVALPEPGEPFLKLQTEASEVWEMLQVMLPSQRERRLAYLLYQCGLKPQEIVRFCPKEWHDLQEIYHLRRNILERLIRNADQLH